MDAVQIRAEIARLPETAQTKPILAGLMEQIESLSNSPGLAAMRQELDALKGAPSHTAGLCNKPECQPCQDARIAVGHQTQEGIVSLFDKAARHYGLEDEMSLIAEAVKRYRIEDKSWSPKATSRTSNPPFIEIG